MAKITEYFALGFLAENALLAAFSASCDYFTEDVRILPVVMPEREFREVQRQIFFAHFVIRAHDATLEQAPETINVGPVDITPHVFTLAVLHRLMVEAVIQ